MAGDIAACWLRGQPTPDHTDADAAMARLRGMPAVAERQRKTPAAAGAGEEGGRHG
jgi:hypothetical protein